ncbi:hypothetical protein LCGC14_1994600, partial [marine sediment metagenome]
TITLANADIDHGGISGLADDDHTQYLRADGTRELTGAWDYGSQTISGTGDIKANTLYGDGNNITNIDGDNVVMARIAGSTYSTSQHMQDIFHSSGWSSGGTITSGTVTSVAVAAGTGFIRPTDSAVATVSYFDWTSSGTLSVPTNTIRYIGVEYNSGSPQAVVRSSYDWDFTTDFPLGIVINESGFLHVTNATHAIGDHANTMIQRSYETMPIKRDDRTGGLILGENGTRNITLTAGGLWERLTRFAISAVVTSGTDTFDRYYRDGSNGWTKEADQTTWNNTQYDDGDGGLATLSPNRHSVQYFYIELDGDLVSLYGQAQYTTLAAAQGDTPPSTVPARLDAHGKLIGRIIFKESAGTASFIESVFDTSFSTTLVTDHGNLSGLTDDDHSQYHTDARGDTRYYTESELDAGQLDNRYHTESEITTISGDLQTNIDALTHNGFADFVANEHIDWTGDAGGDNIHDNNIVSASVTQHEGDIDHDALTNFESNEHFTFASVSGSIDHNTIINNHNLTTDIDHDALTNYAVGQHRIINDGGTSATELWSASQIEGRVVTATGSLTTDHGALTGLSDDDHTQYLLVDDSRAVTNAVLKQNLLTNSGFGVWSNSTLENVGSALADDDCANDDTGDWTLGGAALAFDTDHYEMSTDNPGEEMYLPNISYTAGKLYKISAKLKDGTASPTDVSLKFRDTVAQVGIPINTTGSFVTYTAVFECVTSTATGRAVIFVGTSMAGGNLEMKDFTCY